MYYGVILVVIPVLFDIMGKCKIRNMSIWIYCRYTISQNYNSAYTTAKSLLTLLPSFLYEYIHVNASETGLEEAFWEWSGQLSQLHLNVIAEIPSNSVRNIEAFRGVWGHAPPENFWKWDAQICYFSVFLL